MRAIPSLKDGVIIDKNLMINMVVNARAKYYMINFKVIFHIRCDKIKRPRPPANKVEEKILCSKILQL